MKKSKMLKPINVMTTSFLLASSLLMPSAGFAEELSTPKNKDSSNAQTSEVKTQEARTQTTETQSPGKAVSKMMANETVVNNFQELKVALEADNGITTIHLGRDIDISGAIKIHPAKSKIVIDGNYHTVTETGATGASGGIYANGNILSSVHVKNLYIYGKNYYGFITIHDVTKNVEQIYENVNYNGPQFIWNRNGNAIFKGVNDIYIQDNAVPGSSITHEMAETGSVEFDGETHISHNSGHALIWSISKEPQFKIAPNANVKIFTNKSGYGIFYATGGDGDFSIGANAKVEIDGKKGVTSSGKFKSFNVDAGADVQMNRSGTDSYPMISLYGPAQINNQANLHVTTEDGHALEVENKPSTIDFNNPKNVVLSSIKKQAINNLSTSLTMSMDTSMAKFWTSATGDPTNSYVGKSGGNLTWKAMYRYNVAQSISSSNPENFIIEFTKTKKIELGKNDGGQAEKDLADAKNKVEDLFTDDKFDTLKGSTDQGAIDKAKDAVNKLPAGPEKERLEDLLNKAQDLLNKKEQAEKDLNDAKNKVEDLFTDDKFDTLEGSADQGAIDKAKDAVSKLPAGPEKERLEDLLNKAQDLLNKKEQAEKDLADAKNKVEDLFTDDKFDTLEGTTDQGAIDEAQEAVDKLPEGAEKDRLQDLLNKAQDLLDKDITAPNAPKLNEVTTNSKEVTGSGEPEANVTVTINSNKYTGVVGPDGKFKVAIPNQPVNTVITVTLTDTAGNVSESSSARVIQFMPSEPVKIDTVYKDAQTITGTAPEGATIVRLLVNGVALRTAPVNEDGTFSIYSRYVGVDENGNNITLQPGDIVTVDYGMRTPSNLQAHTTVIKEAEKLQVNPVAPNADYVTGKAPEGTMSLRLLVNGIAQRTVSLTQTGSGVINTDGSYQIYSRFIVDEHGVTRRLQAGDVIEVDNGTLVVGGDIAKTIVK
ncbi:toxin Cry1Ac domain D-VI-related protein [Peribacillus simplex]|uniref:toxin Cry1Ac domain D-VI-related protein n=1 Tax=Peribacillus simplex TaxID=1478 RepID=UPI002E1AA617|nr:toxin Cry1Ac domain D-VI-related protein [Peribacillus simplex]